MHTHTHTHTHTLFINSALIIGKCDDSKMSREGNILFLSVPMTYLGGMSFLVIDTI